MADGLEKVLAKVGIATFLASFPIAMLELTHLLDVKISGMDLNSVVFYTGGALIIGAATLPRLAQFVSKSYGQSAAKCADEIYSPHFGGKNGKTRL